MVISDLLKNIQGCKSQPQTLQLNINLNGGIKKKIDINPNDDPVKVASLFCKFHSTNFFNDIYKLTSSRT